MEEHFLQGFGDSDSAAVGFEAWEPSTWVFLVLIPAQWALGQPAACVCFITSYMRGCSGFLAFKGHYTM